MILKLDDQYSIVSDSNNYTLKYINTYIGVDNKTKQTKEITSKDEWNMPKLSQAIAVYLNECLRPLNSIEELYQELVRVEELIKTIKN